MSFRSLLLAALLLTPALAAADAIIRNNVVFNNRADGIHSHAHQSALVGNLQILHNTVVSSQPEEAAVYISMFNQDRLAGPVVIANNALYAQPRGFALRLPDANAAAINSGADRPSAIRYQPS